MRIAFVGQPFDRLDPPVQGGSLAIWIYQVARRCPPRGHETFVFANHGQATRTSETSYEDVHYRFTPTAFNSLMNKVGARAERLMSRLGRRSAVPPFAASWSDTGYGREVSKSLRALRCDAVLVMNYSQLVPIIRRLNPNITIYLYMQCEWLTQLDRSVMGHRIGIADLVGGCSDYITKKIAERFPEYRQKCFTLNNAAIPAADTGTSERDPNHVMFVGRVSPEKGVHLLVEAFHRVLEHFPDARLHVVGGVGSAPLEFLVGLSDEPHVANLRRFYEPIGGPGKDPYFAHLERAAGAELGRRIIFEGRVNHDQTTAAYRRTSLLVNPSLSESFGMTLVEAMMHGVPVIASRIGGMPYIVDHGATGLLVDADDSTALASAICAMLADREKAREMGKAGKQRALDRFSWDRTAETLINQFESARR
jgi:glycosyltransferase involved in cell wall biosynthesis